MSATSSFLKRIRHPLLASIFALGSLAFISEGNAYTNEVSLLKVPIEGYRPSYFLYGNPDSKLQVSFKVQLLERYRVYFAYSQLMFWELREDSKPFRDLNFNPELFYRYIRTEESNWHVDLGMEHESNGRGGDDSRSWNRTFVRYSFKIKGMEEPELYFDTKFWFAPTSSFDVTNFDIQRYRGFWEIYLTATNFLGGAFDRHDLSFRLYPGGPSGTDPLRGGQELTFRFVGAFKPLALPMLTLQLFNGYGENLLDYKRRRTIFRVGIGF